MEAAHSDMAAQLCAAWVEVAQLKAQLQQAQEDDEVVLEVRALDDEALQPGDVPADLADRLAFRCEREGFADEAFVFGGRRGRQIPGVGREIGNGFGDGRRFHGAIGDEGDRKRDCRVAAGADSTRHDGIP